MKRTAAAMLALLTVLGTLALGGGAAASTASSDESLLSESGQAAIADLRTCLASQDELSVYYLVDTSQSLRTSDDGGPGSDPDALRAPILANSLAELGKLGGEATVSWAAGFFSTQFSTEIGWHEWAEGGPDELEAAISGRTPSGYTNWPAALEGAQVELAGRSGCKLLVWLTDGQIDIRSPDGQGPEDRNALLDMCSESGVFNDYRESGVVVIGALLATTASAQGASSQMRKLVEGVDPASGERCGVSPMPDSYVHGAFVEATSPDSLRLVFLELGAQVGGGYPQPFEPDGSFTIDPGISSFRIIVSGDWTLHPPEDSQLDAATSDSSSEWARFDGASTIDVDTTSAEMQGTWRLESSGARALFLYSGLSIAFDDTTSIVAGENGERSVALGGNVLAHDGSPADLSALDYTLAAHIVSEDGTPLSTFIPLTDPRIDSATGAITVGIPDDIQADTIVIQASLDPLTTNGHRLELMSVTTQESVEMVVPSDYPLIDDVVKLSDLDGAEGEAAFRLHVSAPPGGGEICLDQDPTIADDGVDRGATWDWGYKPGGCTVVPAEGTEIVVTAKNSTAASTQVRAILPVTLKAASGTDQAVYPVQNQDVELEFATFHRTNAVALAGLVFLLLALGILIPLLGLWVLNRLTSTLDVDSSLQRGSFAAKVGPHGIVFPDAPSSDTALSERFRYLASSDKVRTLHDADAGRISTVVPWFPLIRPWYRVQPAAGKRIVVARTAARSEGSGDIRPDGVVKFTQLPLDGFWMFVVSAASLSRAQTADDVDGTVVIYHRASSDGPAQYRERLNRIMADTKVGDAMDRARTASSPPIPKKPGPTETKTSAGVESAQAGSSGTGPGTPPARPSSGSSGGPVAPPARRPAAPPSSGGGAGNPGSTPPPPRSSGPPPRPSSR